ncbi:conserved hypothetical protein [Kribbella flavida DSM 17836]|uniref:Phosphoesterase HXTX n=1 Tax=Kribbella flavida (strain DSM 17836 / JCM 10339 / NBRC 14399) TaxID=479435 RepID=D2PR71_KRIFD|nr:2'-5' RNA ligase family protein [Kribbella flavida]ADB33019.1 conserved hypothetical protein [Kribbella flavida DSM 17836]
MSPPPLIVTVRLDDAGAAAFDVLRSAHYPPHLNVLRAHVTLFHQLPGHETDSVIAELTATRSDEPFALEVVGPRLLGRGVAIDLRSPTLHSLHADLARRWTPWLTRQDRQPFRPHVTIQNKVDPATARQLHDELATTPWPPVSAIGWSLWRYLGGPWDPVTEIPFRSGPPPARQQQSAAGC